MKVNATTRETVPPRLWEFTSIFPQRAEMAGLMFFATLCS